MRVAISGSRTFTNYNLVDQVVDRLIERGDHILVGDARGVDFYVSARLAELQYDKCDIYPADWRRHGRRAGFIRNEAMLENAEQLIAIFAPGPWTPGTSMAVKLAQRKKIPAYVYQEGAWLLRDNDSLEAIRWLAATSGMPSVVLGAASPKPRWRKKAPQWLIDLIDGHP